MNDIMQIRVGDTRGVRGDHGPPLFLQQNEKRKGKEKKKTFKAGTIKRLSPRLNVTVLAFLERLEFKNVYSPPTTVADNTFQYSMTTSL